MKKSIAFLLASLATTSSLLFNTLEANAFAKTTKTRDGYVKECRPGNDIFVLENQGGEFRIFNFATGKREYLPFKLMKEKKALKEFKKLCKGEKTNAIDDRKAKEEKRRATEERKAKEEIRRATEERKAIIEERKAKEEKRRAKEERKAKNKFKNKF